MDVDFGNVWFDRAILVRWWRSCTAIPCTSVSVFIVNERLIFLSRLCSSVSCHVCTRSGMSSVSHIFVLTRARKNIERATF